jgi:hypothetical protein
MTFDMSPSAKKFFERYGEIDRTKLVGCVRVTHTSVHTRDAENASFAGTF